MEISDFSRVIINVGSQHRLPLDCSFKQFEDMVSAKTGEPFSRRMMRNAWEALPINEAMDSSRESVYDYLNQNRYEAYDKETKEKNTYQLPIYWELQDLLSAICTVRRTQNHLKGEELAREVLLLLIQELDTKTPAQMGQRYVDYQLLKEEYTRFELLQKYQKELLQRLDTIWTMTLGQPADVAAEAMLLAFPALDTLVIDLLRIPHSSDNKPAPSALKSMQSYFNRLMGVRPELVKSEHNSTEEYVFQLDGYPNEMSLLSKNLKQLQNTEGKLSKSINVKEDTQAAETSFEWYLRTCAEHKESSSITETVATFLNRYVFLEDFFQSQTWEDIAPLVRKELQVYICRILHDAYNRNYIPYDFSDYTQDRAGSAFISDLCKNAHNQIRAALHGPLQLLTEHAYLQYFLPEIRVIPSEKSKEVLLQISLLLEKQLSGWMLNAATVFKELSSKYKEIPLPVYRPKEDIQKFIRQYNDHVPAVLGGGSLTEKDLEAQVTLLEACHTTVDHVDQIAKLLWLECRMIAVWMLEETIKEIKISFNTLHETYQKISDQRKKAATEEAK